MVMVVMYSMFVSLSLSLFPSYMYMDDFSFMYIFFKWFTPKTFYTGLKYILINEMAKRKKKKRHLALTVCGPIGRVKPQRLILNQKKITCGLIIILHL